MKIKTQKDYRANENDISTDTKITPKIENITNEKEQTDNTCRKIQEKANIIETIEKNKRQNKSSCT